MNSHRRLLVNPVWIAVTVPDVLTLYKLVPPAPIRYVGLVASYAYRLVNVTAGVAYVSSPPRLMTAPPVVPWTL